MKKVLAFGEILLRLSADGDTIIGSRSFSACYGGTESNVLAFLTALGHSTKYLSALPENALGKAALLHLERLGVDTSDVLVGGDTMGMYFAENGTASRGANVVYARRHSAFTHLDENSFDFDKVFDGVDLFHISGISFALSPSSCALSYRLMREARERGVAVSFDFNYRPALWTTEEALPKLGKAAALADILLASHRDLETFMQTDEEKAFEDYPLCTHLVLRDRTVLAPDRHSVRVTVMRNDGARCEMPPFTFPVTEKIGGGDAFNGGMLHGLLEGTNLADATYFAVAAFAMKHTVPGDVLAVPEQKIRDFMSRTEGLLP